MLSAPRAEVKLLKETCDYLPSEHNSHFTMKNPSFRLLGTRCLDIGVSFMYQRSSRLRGTAGLSNKGRGRG